MNACIRKSPPQKEIVFFVKPTRRSSCRSRGKKLGPWVCAGESFRQIHVPASSFLIHKELRKNWRSPLVPEALKQMQNSVRQVQVSPGDSCPEKER